MCAVTKLAEAFLLVTDLLSPPLLALPHPLKWANIL